jgi:formylmethanofuran dehydrogenase subunit D
MKLIVNTIRKVDNDQVREYSFGDFNSLKEKLAIGFINPDDFKKLNLTSKSNLRLINNFGSVVIRPEEDKNVPVGVINIPVSIWVNQITGSVNEEPVYKNISVDVEVTNDLILGINEIMNKIKE